MSHLYRSHLEAFILISSLWWQAQMATAKVTGYDEPKIEDDWWNHAVFYQIYPRSFMDSNNDGVGDIRGIISKLSYLAETGITATWLSPIFQSPMVDFGYDIANFKAIHEEYGTMKDFDDLIVEANRLGIKIILDFVPNHTSDQCLWFKKSASREKGFEDFYIWSDGKLDEKGSRIPPNNWQSVFYGSAWTWHPKREQYYLHQFTVEQPDLNYRNPNVVSAMDDVIHFWLDKGVSGFRVDAVNHLYEVIDLSDEPLSKKTEDKNSYDYTKHIYTKDLPEVYGMLQHWRQLLDQYDTPTRIMMSEAYAEIKPLMDYYETTDGVRGAHFPLNFFLITDLNAESDARDFVFTIQKWLAYMPRGHIANWVLGNHDSPRVASRLGAARVDSMHMLLMTLPGVAVTYNGEEIGMRDYRELSWAETVDPPALNAGPEKYKNVSRDPARTPFQWNNSKNAGFSTADKTWLPVHPDYVNLNLEMQMNSKKSCYGVYKSLVKLRKLPALHKGHFHAEVYNRDIFAFKRELKGHATLITVINIGALEQNVDLTELFDLPKKLEILIAGSNSTYEEGTLIVANSTFLAAYEALIVSVNTTFSDDRRALIKTLIKSANIIFLGLLMYKLWNNKWTKLNFNKATNF